MWAIPTHVSWFVYLPVSRPNVLDTTVSPAETHERIEMPLVGRRAVKNDTGRTLVSGEFICARSRSTIFIDRVSGESNAIRRVRNHY